MSKHSYEYKGVTLYYDLPDDEGKLRSFCATLGCPAQGWVDLRKVVVSIVNNTLRQINITPVDHDGGWK
jgi:hypothetical protein